MEGIETVVDTNKNGTHGKSMSSVCFLAKFKVLLSSHELTFYFVWLLVIVFMVIILLLRLETAA